MKKVREDVNWIGFFFWLLHYQLKITGHDTTGPGSSCLDVQLAKICVWQDGEDCRLLISVAAIVTSTGWLGLLHWEQGWGHRSHKSVKLGCTSESKWNNSGKKEQTNTPCIPGIQGIKISNVICWKILEYYTPSRLKKHIFPPTVLTQSPLISFSASFNLISLSSLVNNTCSVVMEMASLKNANHLATGHIWWPGTRRSRTSNQSLQVSQSQHLHPLIILRSAATT